MELFRLSISKGFFDTDSNFMLDLLLFWKKGCDIHKTVFFQKLLCSYLKLRLILLENSRTIKLVSTYLSCSVYIERAFLLPCYAAAELCSKTTDGYERLREFSFSVLTKRRMICRQSEKEVQRLEGAIKENFSSKAT